MMDQILLRRSDEHTPWLSAERIPSHLSDACAEACNIVRVSPSRRFLFHCQVVEVLSTTIEVMETEKVMCTDLHR
jgi:hypothetical protein